MKLAGNICLITFMGILAQSYSYAGTMDGYFKNDENMKKYNEAVSSGIIKKQKDSMNMACQREKEVQSDLDCGCVKDQLAMASDKEFYYSGIMAYKNFQDQVQARRENDEEKYERLRKNQDQQDGLIQRMEKTCKLK